MPFSPIPNHTLRLYISYVPLYGDFYTVNPICLLIDSIPSPTPLTQTSSSHPDSPNPQQLLETGGASTGWRRRAPLEAAAARRGRGGRRTGMEAVAAGLGRRGPEAIVWLHLRPTLLVNGWRSISGGTVEVNWRRHQITPAIAVWSMGICRRRPPPAPRFQLLD
jgi:hypothetical protein